MFGRERVTEPAPEIEAPAPPPKPKLTPEEVMRRHFDTPTTMASRKAAREAAGIPDRPAPALVSLGTSEHVQRRPRTGSKHIPGDDVEVVTVELYYDKHTPAHRYYRMEGDTVIYPLFDDAPPAEKPVPLGRVRAEGFRSGNHLPAGDEQSYRVE